ncbi:hypothetical protein J6G99_01835 [bacterium]|nr:hypothetical protein [bacterium]
MGDELRVPALANRYANQKEALKAQQSGEISTKEYYALLSDKAGDTRWFGGKVSKDSGVGIEVEKTEAKEDDPLKVQNEQRARDAQLRESYENQLAAIHKELELANTEEDKQDARARIAKVAAKLSKLDEVPATGVRQTIKIADMTVSPDGKAVVRAPKGEEGQELIDDISSQYTTKGAGSKKKANQNLRDTFGKSYLSDSDLDESKAELKRRERDVDHAQKEYKHAVKHYSKHGGDNATNNNAQRVFEAQDDLAQKNDAYLDSKSQIEGEKIARKIANGGMKRTVRHMRKDYESALENMQNVHDINYAVQNEDAKKEFLDAHPEVDAKEVAVLDKKERRAIIVMSAVARDRIQKARAAYAKSSNSANREALREVEDKYMPYLKAMGADENLNMPKNNDKVVINGKDMQDALARLSGKDFEFNLDEIDAIHQQTGLSKRAIKSTVEELGFGTEGNHLLQRIGIGLGVAGATALIENLFNHKKIAEAHAHGEQESFMESRVVVEDEKIVNDQVQISIRGKDQLITYVDPNTGATVNKRIAGEVYTKTVPVSASAYAKAEAYASAYAKAVADASAKAVAKVPFLSTLAGPVLAGVTAFLAAKPETQDVFKGNVDAVLHDLNLVKGKEAKAFVYQIQNMQFTDKDGKVLPQAQSDVIKAAVLKAAMGEDTKKMNNKELAMAFANLQEVQKYISRIGIEVANDDPQPTISTTPTEPTTPTTPTEPADCTNEIVKGDVVKPKTHKVTHHETIDTILRAYYPGVKLSEAKKAFRKANPDLKYLDSIRVGQEFVLPKIGDVEPKDKANVRKVYGGRKIKFRPSNVRGPKGEQMWQEVDCHTGQNVGKPMTTEQAAKRKKEIEGK